MDAGTLNTGIFSGTLKMSAIQMLVEKVENANFIVESTTTGKDMYINGIFMQAEIRNRNQRIYPYAEIKNACDWAAGMIKENNGIFGELDHPNNLTIDPKNVSHAILDLKMQGNDAYGRAKLLNTPAGLIAKELFNSGVKVGVSSRGAGEVTEGIVRNFQFITIDVVVNPSAQGATPSAVMESVEQARNANKIMSLAEALQHDDSAQKYFQKEIMSWLNTNVLQARK